MILNKRDLIHKLDGLTVRLRCQAGAFIAIEGVPDFNAADIRLNRLGKCLEMSNYLILMGTDGQEMTETTKAHYDEFIRYLNECHQAFEIGKKPA